MTIDGREEAPAAFHPNIFCADAVCAADPGCKACPTGPVPSASTGGLAGIVAIDTIRFVHTLAHAL